MTEVVVGNVASAQRTLRGSLVGAVLSLLVCAAALACKVGLVGR